MSRSRIRPTMARPLAFLVLGAGLFSLGGCAQNPATGARLRPGALVKIIVAGDGPKKLSQKP